ALGGGAADRQDAVEVLPFFPPPADATVALHLQRPVAALPASDRQESREGAARVGSLPCGPEPEPSGGPGARRRKQGVAPAGAGADPDPHTLVPAEAAPASHPAAGNQAGGLAALQPAHRARLPAQGRLGVLLDLPRRAVGATLSEGMVSPGHALADRASQESGAHAADPRTSV